MIIRVIVPPYDMRKAADLIRDALKNPEVDSVVIHKPSSHMHLSDGRELVFDAMGRLVAA